ncbi:MAG TPA: hypothetical protein VKZ53_18720 [Candidatus Angelobacter sp.]|nr:hypothetical protein [Candidatus Angelobacter sp.]
MPETVYRSRRAFQLENNHVRITVLAEGGHIAELLHKESGVNPLWTPPWPSIEPSTYSPSQHPEYGNDAESKLLSGLMGHNLCVDLFGSPSADEAAAGLTVHGEASIVPYSITSSKEELNAKAVMPIAQLAVERRIRLAPQGSVMHVTETIENLATLDRPSAWTQHVTLGPPFLERGETQFRVPATLSRTIGGLDFNWPHLPHEDKQTEDLQVYTCAEVSAGFSAHLLDPCREQAFFLAYSSKTKVLVGYIWKQSDFPWLGIWEENRSRGIAPWNGKTMTRGMEFGASPFPEPRRRMIDRNKMFGVPCYRWIPAKSKVTVSYCAFITKAERIAEDVVWDGGDGVRLA